MEWVSKEYFSIIRETGGRVNGFVRLYGSERPTARNKKPAQRPVRNYLSNLSKSAVKTGSRFGATVNGKVPETGPLNNCGD